MKKLCLLFLTVLVCLSLAACGRQSAARAERGKPRVVVSSQMLTLYRAPGANADILADGSLKIDDILLPLSDQQHQQLQLLFARLQILRQNALTDAKPDPQMGTIPLQGDAPLQSLEQDILRDIKPLEPYADSFTLLLADRR